ncbi:hypothetical protein FGL86_10530 [Pistricoccus aurantiacus]|uniref:WYL domain-containing protein n=1 Tax=Pistricoccus aurantiacus TaxID=1883414 RepID=A0A5B8SU21_9GAMM|nr:WYL domain-containing protein [Pistricoccus aurantiacus]QEA39467.1 hypothetical protein FGL86_10530 [Pistricoccus aurantiacus]
MTDFAQDLGTRLLQERERLELTIDALVTQARLSEARLHRPEAGGDPAEPNAGGLAVLDVAGIDVTYLLTGQQTLSQAEGVLIEQYRAGTDEQKASAAAAGGAVEESGIGRAVPLRRVVWLPFIMKSRESAERRAVVMEWYEVLFFLGLLWAAGAQWDRGIQHRRKARQDGKDTHSLWWHVRAADELKKANKYKKSTGKSAATSTESLKWLQEANCRAAHEALSSKRWKKKAKKARESANHALSGLDEREANAYRPDDRLCFIYKDSQGNITTREVSSWDNDSTYIEGFCHRAGDIRTFRRDRIVEFLEGEELLGPEFEEVDPKPKSSVPSMEILFTGFSAEEREELEADAQDAGLQVRKTVTKNLGFVCAGPRAGSTKLSRARAQGCMILNEDEFQQMLATGEVPA